MKYSLEIFLSIILSLILAMVANFFTCNIVLSASIFTASLVTIQFLINRYENRLDVIVKMQIIKDNNNEFLVSIKNNGGKTLYLESGGIKTKEGVIVDFDEQVKQDRESPFYICPRPMLPYTLNPGQSKNVYRSISDVLRLLKQYNFNFSTDLEIKGFFKDQLDRTYEAPQFEKYNIEKLFEMIEDK